MVAASCMDEEAQESFFVSSLSHSLCFTGVQGRFLASLEMTIRGKRYSRISGFTDLSQITFLHASRVAP